MFHGGPSEEMKVAETLYPAAHEAMRQQHLAYHLHPEGVRLYESTCREQPAAAQWQ